MPPLYVLTAVDVRRAEEEGSSRATTISKLMIPSVKFLTVDHNPGGGVMQTSFALPRIEAPEPKMEVKGVDLDIFRGLGKSQRWVFAQALRDTQTGADVPARAVIEGAIVDWEPDEAAPDEFQGCTHMFKEVTHYEFSLNGEELFYIDFFERVLRVAGEDHFAGVRNALGA